jgi:hypothetical protein
MKRLFIALAILFTPTLAISAENLGKMEADSYYKVKAWTGFSPRVVEFSPKANPDYTCVFLTGMADVPGLSCFPKKK